MIGRSPVARRQAGRRTRLLPSLLLGIFMMGAFAPPLDPGPAAAQTQEDPIPIYAYYYIWFDPGSWRRAKIDYPLLGRYSSDSEYVMRKHIEWASKVGIEGFIVSWKDTEVLSRRLEQLVTIAEEEDFEISIIYQGLNFERQPLPVQRVASDLERFVTRFGTNPVFASRFGKPVVIWSGTWEFSVDEVREVAELLGDRVWLLASERDVDAYRDLADLVDGNAYYWSSVDPGVRSEEEEAALGVEGNVSGLGTPGYEDKLQQMGEAIHRNDGLWFAPAAPGFDARLLGGWRVIERFDGETLRRQLEVALASSPDVLGLISWNEFSENTHIEPSERHGRRALEVVANVRGAPAPELGEFASDDPGGTEVAWGNVARLGVLILLVFGSMVALIMRRQGQKHHPPAPESPAPPP